MRAGPLFLYLYNVYEASGDLLQKAEFIRKSILQCCVI